MADQYLAADERAGLQAKKDEQPHNTARSYAAKQREWKVRRAYSCSSYLLTSCP